MNGPQAPKMIGEDVDQILYLALTALDCLDDLTTDAFSKGGDKPARDALQQIIAIREAR